MLLVGIVLKLWYCKLSAILAHLSWGPWPRSQNSARAFIAPIQYSTSILALMVLYTSSSDSSTFFLRGSVLDPPLFISKLPQKLSNTLPASVGLPASLTLLCISSILRRITSRTSSLFFFFFWIHWHISPSNAEYPLCEALFENDRWCHIPSDWVFENETRIWRFVPRSTSLSWVFDLSREHMRFGGYMYMSMFMTREAYVDHVCIKLRYIAEYGTVQRTRHGLDSQNPGFWIADHTAAFQNRLDLRSWGWIAQRMGVTGRKASGGII